MKGFSISAIIGLIIGVIVLVVLIPLLFKSASDVWEQLMETLGVVKYSPIERAIICYYHLCKTNSDCKDSTFYEFCSPEKIGRANYEEVCSLAYALGMEGKQCTEASFQFPLIIQLEADSEISKDRLKRKIDTTHLLIATNNTEGGPNWNEILLHLIPFYAFWTAYRLLTETLTVVFIAPQNLKDVEEESYSILTTTYSHLVRFARLKSGTYYVSGMRIGGGWFEGPPRYFIHLDNYPRYVSISSTKSSGNITLVSGQAIRISMEEEKNVSESLADYNYMLKIEIPLTCESDISPVPPGPDSIIIKVFGKNRVNKLDKTIICSSSNNYCIGESFWFSTMPPGEYYGNITIEIVDTKYSVSSSKVMSMICYEWAAVLNISYSKEPKASP